MILGFGFDVLQSRRLERELARGEWRPGDGVFTPAEIAYCNSTRKPAGPYAACFAAKEATLKALGLRVTDLAMFPEVEVGLAANRIVLHRRLKTESARRGVRRIRLATVVTRDLAGAMVILEG